MTNSEATRHSGQALGETQDTVRTTRPQQAPGRPTGNLSRTYLMILLLKFLVQRHFRMQARQKVWEQEDRIPNLRSEGLAF